MTATRSDTLRIESVSVTPVAFADPPLLNVVGVHEPFALRAIVVVHAEGGYVGLGESYGDSAHLDRLGLAAAALRGIDVFAVNTARERVEEALARDRSAGGHGMSGMVTGSSTLDRVFSPFEVACLDIQGKALQRPVVDLLGGAVRDRVPFSGYLFYKWAGHPGADADVFGEALTPAALVTQARTLVERYGFRSLKLKGGVRPPAEEVAAIRAVREAFPDLPLRLDPNGAWTPQTAVWVAGELDGVLQYLEDPTPGIEGMAEVAAQVNMPLATNQCVVAFDHLEPAIRQRAVQIVLSDHHFWGGLRRSALLAGICDTFGLGLSMHSNSHLGISLAAMVHLAAATPNLTYACDTHWPWKDPGEDVIAPGVLELSDGAVPVPRAAGLGVELDPDALAHLHEQYLRCGLTERDDTGYMRRFVPDFSPSIPRW